ncbi:MAG: bifunctional UDP-4-keto-pentose/UDP-xylose synthase [Dongiaceae bacterium]
MRILILGANGFIGSHLSAAILAKTNWEIVGIDLADDRLEESLKNPRFHLIKADITENPRLVTSEVAAADVVLPLVAIATPSAYVTKPLAVFELDFEANLAVIRDCVQFKKRVIFPSTSEVYGMCDDPEFKEETSPLVMGPAHKHRWIYGASKQLLDRLLFAYGMEKGLKFSIFRPFNWVGPKLDNISAAKEGSSRMMTQFIGNILRGQDIKLVDGGNQRRCFIYIDDAVEAVVKIIENKDGAADGKIFNIGHPGNDYSVREVAEMLLQAVAFYPGYGDIAKRVKITHVPGENYYGEGYQDIPARVPSIAEANKYLKWQPTTGMEDIIKKTLDYYVPRWKESSAA